MRSYYHTSAFLCCFCIWTPCIGPITIIDEMPRRRAFRDNILFLSSAESWPEKAGSAYSMLDTIRHVTPERSCLAIWAAKISIDVDLFAYPMTCNPALTQMRLRRSLRHFSSNVHLTQIDSISFFISIYTFISSRVVSAPGHFCIAALYKFLLYCIVLYKHPVYVCWSGESIVVMSIQSKVAWVTRSMSGKGGEYWDA